MLETWHRVHAHLKLPLARGFIAALRSASATSPTRHLDRRLAMSFRLMINTALCLATIYTFDSCCNDVWTRERRVPQASAFASKHASSAYTNERRIMQRCIARLGQVKLSDLSRLIKSKC